MEGEFMGYIGLSRDADKLNSLLNHPEIKPYLIDGDKHETLDASCVLSLPNTYFLLFDGGGLLFWEKHNNIYEGDIYFLPRHRGVEARQAAIYSLYFMFTSADARKIEVKTLRSNAASRHFISGLGFRRISDDDQVITYELTRQEWDRLSAG